MGALAFSMEWLFCLDLSPDLGFVSVENVIEEKGAYQHSIKYFMSADQTMAASLPFAGSSLSLGRG